MRNVREFVGSNQSYTEFNREERNLSAVFFYLLLREGNLRRFLKHIDVAVDDDLEHSALYFEFAYLRDLWTTLEPNTIGRALITQFLPLRGTPDLTGLPILNFNQFFGAVPAASATTVQSPCNWSMARYDSTIADNDDFLDVCRFKWAFNAKPDIVIQLSDSRCVCIEAKLGSGEGSYPQIASEKAVFVRRGIKPVSQTEVQKYVMSQLLGYDTTYVFLAKQTPPHTDGYRVVTWKESFAQFDLAGIPGFVRNLVERNS